MSDIKITKDQLVSAVLKYENSTIENPRADFNGVLLPSCKYYQDGRRCLIGQALSDLGISDETLQRFDQNRLSASGLAIWADADARDLASDLQEGADQGVFWRDAIRHVREEGGF